METEIWKDIPGYEGEYQASTHGRIKSLERLIERPHPKSKVSTLYKIRERILKGVSNRHGYYVVGLGQHNIKKVHRMVALTFFGECPLGQEVRHLNGCRTDNRIENLKYGSRSENHLDRYSYGNSMGALLIEDVLKIKEMLACENITTSQIAANFDVTAGAIYHIRQGRTYQWLK